MPLDWLNDASLMAPPRAVRVPLDDGCFVLRSPETLKPYARCVGEWLEHWAAQTPDAPAFAERQADGGWLLTARRKNSFPADERDRYASRLKRICEPFGGRYDRFVPG